jgi:hypothetical protein
VFVTKRGHSPLPEELSKNHQEHVYHRSSLLFRYCPTTNLPNCPTRSIREDRIAELGFPLAAVFVNAYFIPGKPIIHFDRYGICDSASWPHVLSPRAASPTE